MKLFHEIIKRIRDEIAYLDNGSCKTTQEAKDLVDYLRRELTPRESTLMLRAETVKENIGDSEDDLESKRRIDDEVFSVCKEIDESGYVGGKKIVIKRPKIGSKIKRVKPKKVFSESKMERRDFRFEYSRDFAYVRDCQHTASQGYKIPMYEGLNGSPIVVEAIEALLYAVRNKKSEGWWTHGDKINWRGAFQKGVYLRFYNEQIQRGNKKNGHPGQWRFFTKGEFDELSPKGKYFKRKQA